MMRSETDSPSARSSSAAFARHWPALAGLAIVFLVEMADNSILNVALPTIARSLHATAVDLQWISGGYSLVFGSTMLLFGGLADRYGRRRLLLIGLMLFTAASACVIWVTTPGQLIAVRAVLGLSAAMTAPGTMALSFRLFPDDALRARASALITGVGMLGLVAGPLLGGLALSVAPWQALLVVNVPLVFLAALAIARGIRADQPGELRQVTPDLLGGCLAGLSLACLLLAPTMGLEYGWMTWRPLSLGAAGIALMIGFAIRERTATHPLVRLGLLGLPPVRAGLSAQLAMALALAAVGFTVQLQLQFVWGWSPAQAALGNLPQIFAMVAGGAIVEPALRRLGLARSALLGAFVVVSGVLLYATCSRYGYLWIAAAMMLIAPGMRLVMITSTMRVMKGMPRDHLSIASALNDTAQEIGSAIGIAVTGTVLASFLVGSIGVTTWDTATIAAFDHAILTAGIALAATTALITLITQIGTHVTPDATPTGSAAAAGDDAESDQSTSRRSKA